MPGDDMDGLRDRVVSYLSRRATDLKCEIQDSDQYGPWDERDHLYDELEEVSTLLERLGRRG